MKKQLLSTALGMTLFFGAAGQAQTVTHQQTTARRHYVQHTTSAHNAQRSAYVRHKRHMKTAKRVGIGAAGGAAVGALAGGGTGAGIGAAAGAGAGYLYDRHKKHTGHY